MKKDVRLTVEQFEAVQKARDLDSAAEHDGAIVFRNILMIDKGNSATYVAEDGTEIAITDMYDQGLVIPEEINEAMRGGELKCLEPHALLEAYAEIRDEDSIDPKMSYRELVIAIVEKAIQTMQDEVRNNLDSEDPTRRYLRDKE